MSGGWKAALAERGVVPLPLMRRGIRALLRQRLRSISGSDQRALVDALGASPIALATDQANRQHYEVPAEFFDLVLGPHHKYSGCYWAPGVETLAQAEVASLEQVCRRAQLEDGQRMLELGCGWGAFSLYAAARYRNASIVGVSNSRSQAAAINARRPRNLEIVTADMNAFQARGRFDRIVSIEMFEHMRNYDRLFRRIAGWLEPEGKLFAHVFCHRSYAYPFDTDGETDWMARHFFTHGLMPSLRLFDAFDRDLDVEERWALDGTHYQRTAAVWRGNLERHRAEVMDLFRRVYGAQAGLWYHRWRLFFLACEELFGYRDGQEWMVGHFRLTHVRRPPGTVRMAAGTSAAT